MDAGMAALVALPGRRLPRGPRRKPHEREVASPMCCGSKRPPNVRGSWSDSG